jgi:hypothetical protein
MNFFYSFTVMYHKQQVCYEKVIFLIKKYLFLFSENFRSLCVDDKHLCYVGSKLTHIFPQYLIGGNDFINIFSLII